MSSPWAKLEKPDPVGLEEIISKEKQDRKFKGSANKNCQTSLELIGGSVFDSNKDITKGPYTQFENINEDLMKVEDEDFLTDSEEESLDTSDIQLLDKADKSNLDVLVNPQGGYRNNGLTGDLKLMSDIKNACRVVLIPEKCVGGENVVYESGPKGFTYVVLYKMIESGYLKRINGIVSTGREAVILHANIDASYSLNTNVPKECAVKVFKLAVNNPVPRSQYDSEDNRFRDRWYSRDRNTIMLCAKKEMVSLVRMQEVGVPCPKVVAVNKHILVMEFIGENQTPAPILREAVMSKDDYLSAYQQVIENMKVLYTKAKLVHADLTEHNILWYRNKCYFIDVSVSVQLNHGQVFLYLYRDCKAITKFFLKKKVPDVPTPEELFKLITGYNFGDRITLDKIIDRYATEHPLKEPKLHVNVAMARAEPKFPPEINLEYPHGQCITMEQLDSYLFSQ